MLVMLALAPLDSPPGPQVPDSVAHAAAYGLQTLFIYLLFVEFNRSRGSVAAAAICAIGFGVFTEALQLLQPARSVGLGDIVANSVGVAIAGAGISGIVRMNRRRSGA
jgi:VanZ family protein